MCIFMYEFQLPELFQSWKITNYVNTEYNLMLFEKQISA